MAFKCEHCGFEGGGHSSDCWLQRKAEKRAAEWRDEEIDRLRADLAASQGRIAQLEEASRSAIGQLAATGTVQSAVETLDKALTSTPSAAAEVLRAAEEWWKSLRLDTCAEMPVLCEPDAKLAEAVRKYKEPK